MERVFKKLRVSVFLILVITLISSMFIAHADSAPKPDISITFKNAPQEEYYMALISNKGAGPHGLMPKPTSSYYEQVYNGLSDVGKKMVTFQDVDGYMLMPDTVVKLEDNVFYMGYYPPEEFKVLIYYPKTDTFVVSEHAERYLFNSYFEIDLSGVDVEKQDQVVPIQAKYSHNFLWILLNFVCLLIGTFGIEILVALMFKLKSKAELKIILLVNLITQLILNIELQLIGIFAQVGHLYILFGILEVLVFIIESIVYCKYLKPVAVKEHKNIYYVSYAMVANFISLLLGITLSLTFFFIRVLG